MPEVHQKELNDPGSPPSVDDFCVLANSFADQKMYDKAIQIYESACKLFPDNLALKINLGRVRSLRNQALDTPSDFMRPSVPGNSQERDLWAVRFQGVGEMFLKNGRHVEAQKIFEISRQSNPSFYLSYLDLGRMHLEKGSFGAAIKDLEQARKLNPFNEEIADLLSVAYFQEREYRVALECAVDAFILSGEVTKTSSGGRYRSKIKMIVEKIPGFSNSQRNELIRERRNRINRLYEEVEIELVKLAPEAANPPPPTATPDPSAPLPVAAVDELEMARKAYEMGAQLKKHLIFRNMEDAAVLKVARFTSEMKVLQADYVYQEGDPIYGLYLVSKGKAEIQKATPYGPIAYATFEKGNFFGDDNLLSGRNRFTSAVAVQETELLFIDKAGLATIFAREKAIAIHFLWYFWKSLSFQIRESNDRMTSFFAGSTPQAKKDMISGQKSGGRPTNIEIDKKLEVLQTKGLPTKDLNLLAKFSNEELYNEGESIFREGDMGDRLYIVLEGSVLISKNIPGAGEEALAVLKKGDFFGEMALVGQHHRSADAKAQSQGTTVLVITKSALREILSIDTDSAYQFLTILCRILSQRLLEMNEKIYQWRLMSGAFS